MTMLNLALALMLMKEEEEYVKRRKEFENELNKVYNEAIANGSTVEKEAKAIFEALCETATRSHRVFNIIIGQEDNLEEETFETVEFIKEKFQEAIDKSKDLEEEIKKMIEAIALYATDIAIMQRYVVENDLGLEVALKVLAVTL